ncbi:CPBP family intramembrane glutamic endopeptidase [Cognatilysobacter tabacisoli]|uniref:CPBP family intramembrane glutamic endopeptidase n=1 Tax=Cognatilysobacter tabacisoli TaxID=2315424 RepID=UPI001300755F|nr:type II CAAX endopeptidase family protein [Lysobacter tabacisoli]
MTIRTALWRLIASAAFVTVSSAAFAQAAPDPQESVELVKARKADAYREVLQRFDAALQAAPKDAALAVKRCEYIAAFTDEEYGEWVEGAPAELEACQQHLTTAHPRSPEARLYLQQQLWGEEAVEAGEALLKQADAWAPALRAKLLAHLSEMHGYEDNDARAGELAVQSVGLGDRTRLATAVEYHASQQEYAAGARLLAQAPPADERWIAEGRIKAALALPDGRVALGELRRYASAKFEINDDLAGRVHLHAGDLASAARLLKASTGKGAEVKQARFDVALATGNYAAAADLVDLTDGDNLPENAQRFAQVLTAAPHMLLIKPSMLAGVIMAGAMLLMLALLPAVILVPVHYRGLTRRLAGRVPVPLFERVGLRHAWFGMAVFLVVPLAVGAMVEPGAVVSQLGEGDVGDPGAMFRVMLWGTTAGLACLLLGARGMGLRHLIGGAPTWGSTGRVLLAWMGLLAIGSLLGWFHSGAGGAETQQTQMVQALAKGGASEAGLAVTLLLMAVVAPVAEEIVFRGLLLGGLSRHIGFAWANLLQSALFAVSHNDWPRLPFYLAMGLLGGWLVRRSGSLGSAIALHVLNNMLAVILVIHYN